MSTGLQNISKKRKFVADGVFYSELNEVCNFGSDGRVPKPKNCMTNFDWIHL